MTLKERAVAIADDQDAGASELMARLLPVIDDAIRAGGAVTAEVVRIVCARKPLMAGLWNACAAAIAEEHAPGTFARRRDQMLRASRALTRAAGNALIDLLDREPGRVVLTVSYSGGVADALMAAAAERPLDVICGEGRPRYEGRRFAERLALAGIRTTVVTDAALTSYLEEAQAFLCGADALLERGWINKVGTRGVAAAASLAGVPTYVIATRDKAIDSRWEQVSRPALRAPADGRLFEFIAAEFATLFLTDAGRLAPHELSSLSPPTAEFDRLIALLSRS